MVTKMILDDNHKEALMRSGIYRIINKSNGKMYVGSSMDVDKRLSHHYSNLKRGKHHNSKLLEEYTSSTWDFNFEVIELCPVEDMIKREDFWINHYDSVLNGYNIMSKSCNNGPRKKSRFSKAAKKRNEDEAREYFCKVMREFVKYKDWDNPESVEIALKTFNLQGEAGLNPTRLNKFSDVVLGLMEECLTLKSGIYHVDHFHYLGGCCNYSITKVEKTKYQTGEEVYRVIAQTIVKEFDFVKGRKYLRDLEKKGIILLD